MFFQSHQALGRAEGGLGVGLSLVRGLVMLHGGSVQARSEGPGKGSEFIVQLPTGAPLAEALDAEVESDCPVADVGLKILVVDDNRDAADTCATLLQLSGHLVQTAYSGRRALELAESSQPDVLLLDIGMTDMDGYTLAEQIRAAEWSTKAVLVAVSGWGREEDRRRAFAAGFDHHLTKPMTGPALESLLQSVSSVRRGARGTG